MLMGFKSNCLCCSLCPTKLDNLKVVPYYISRCENKHACGHALGLLVIRSLACILQIPAMRTSYWRMRGSCTISAMTSERNTLTPYRTQHNSTSTSLLYCRIVFSFALRRTRNGCGRGFRQFVLPKQTTRVNGFK